MAQRRSRARARSHSESASSSVASAYVARDVSSSSRALVASESRSRIGSHRTGSNRRMVPPRIAVSEIEPVASSRSAAASCDPRAVRYRSTARRTAGISEDGRAEGREQLETAARNIATVTARGRGERSLLAHRPYPATSRGLDSLRLVVEAAHVHVVDLIVELHSLVRSEVSPPTNLERRGPPPRNATGLFVRVAEIAASEMDRFEAFPNHAMAGHEGIGVEALRVERIERGEPSLQAEV